MISRHARRRQNRRRPLVKVALGASLFCAGAVHAQWIGATTGTTNDAAHSYLNTANWTGATVLSTFAPTLTGATTLYFNAGYAPGAPLTINYAGNFALNWQSDGTADQTLTLGGDVILNATGGNLTTTLGNATANSGLALDLNGAVRTFSVAGGDTLSLLNALAGGAGAGIAKNGGGTVTYTNTTAPTFDAGTTVSGGALNWVYSPAAGSNTVSFGTGTITLNNGGVFTFNAAGAPATSTQTLSNDFTIGSLGGTIAGGSSTGKTFNFSGALALGGTLSFGNILGGGGGAPGNTYTGTITLDQAAAGNRQIVLFSGGNHGATISGNIVDGSGSAGNRLVLRTQDSGNGANTNITGTGNTWAGGTTIAATSSAGRFINVGATSALGTGAVTVNPGGFLQLNSTDNVAGTGNVTLQPGGVVQFATITANAGIGEISTASTGVLAVSSTANVTGLDLATSGHSSLFVGVGNQATVALTAGWTPNGTTYRVAGGVGGASSRMDFSANNLLTGANDLVHGSAFITGTTQVNNSQDFSGTTTVDGGTLRLDAASAGGKFINTSALTVRGGAVFQNGSGTVANNTAARVNAGSSVTLGGSAQGGGTYTLGLSSAGFTQQHTTLTINPGLNTITSTGTGTTPATLEFTGARSHAVGGVVNVLTLSANYSVKLAETSVGNLGPNVLVGFNPTGSGTGDWGKTDGTGVVSALAATAQNVDPDSWTDNSDVYVSTSGTYTLNLADKTINSLRMTNAGSAMTLNINAGITLTVTNGGVLINSQSGETIGGGGTLASASGNDLYLYGNGNASQGTPVGVVLKAGDGTRALVLTAGGNGPGTSATNTGAFYLQRANNVGDLYVLSSRADSQAPGAFGTGNTYLLGGGISFSNVAHTHSADVTTGSQAAVLGAGTYVQQLTGNVTANGNLVIGAGNSSGATTANGVLLLNPGSGKSVSGQGAITVSAANVGFAAKATSALLSGNLNVAGGVLVLDGRSSGNDIMSYAALTAARPYGTGPGEWQLSSGGLAARGATVDVNLASSGASFDRNFTLGVAARDANGAFFANASVNLTQDIELTGDRTISVAAQGPGLGLPLAQAVVQRISGNLSGYGNPVFQGATTGSTGLGVAEVVLSGSNNAWTGSRSVQGVSTGVGGLGLGIGSGGGTGTVYVRFDDTALASNQTSLPTGGGSSPAFLTATNNNTTGTPGYLFTGSVGGTTYYLSNAPSGPARNLRLFIGSMDTAGNNNRPGTLGSTGGSATLAGAPVLIQGGPASSNVSSLNIIVRDGTFTLGLSGAGNEVKFVPSYTTSTAATVLPDFTNLSNPTGARTIAKSGVGTAILGNVAYTQLNLSTDASAQFTWQIGSPDTTQNLIAQVGNAFGGAVREGSTAATDLSTVKVTLSGGVLEFAATPRGTGTLTLGTGVGQINMNGGNGAGFAAVGGARSVTLNVATPVWQSTTGFMGATGSLIFGSLTADSTLTLTNNIDLYNNNTSATRTIATVRGTGSTPEGELTGVLSKSGSGTANLIIGGMLNPDGTPLAAGSLVLSGANSYNGTTVIQSGTLILGGNAPVSANGTLGNAASTVQVGDTRSTLAAVKAASTANLAGFASDTITTNWTAIDGVTLGIGDRVLLKNQSTAAQNGVYTLTGTTATGQMLLTRVTDGSVYGRQVQVSNGATQVGRTYYVSGSNAWSIDTDPTVALLANGPYTIARSLDVGGSSLGTATLGGTNTSGTATFSGTVVINKNVTLTAAAGGTVAFTGLISDGAGTFGITKTGGGTVVLGNTNSYDGSTTVSGGTLQLDVIGAVPGGITNNATVAFNTGGTFAGLIDGTGAVTKLGAGTLIFSSANSYSGATTVSGGTLQFDALPTATSGITNDATVDFNIGGTFAAAIGGTGAVSKSGSGTLTLTANNGYSGATNVNGGTLIIGSSGNLSGTSGVNVASGATLTWNSASALNAALVSVSSGGTLNGTGSLTGNLTISGVLSGTSTLAGAVSGSGEVDPGNSPGILTVGQVDPTGGLDFNFEFTATGSPNYGNAGASINDVLRVTDGTTPFTAGLGGSNLVGIYLNVTGLAIADQFRGGWYTDLGSDFLGSISGGAYTFYVFGDGGGSHSYNSVNYYTLAEYNTATSSDFAVNTGTTAETANFGGGPINGYVTQFTVVPEPGTLALLSLGSLAVLRRRRQQKKL